MTAVAGPDGRLRCPWAVGAADYVAYHDEEWGRPVDLDPATADDRVFERMSLEGFQSGLSWLTILRKRPAFRAAFAGFALEQVAAFTPSDVDRLLADAGIVRNRAKIEATIGNAERALELPGGLAAHLRSFAPDVAPPAPRATGDIPAETAESRALAKDLRRRGFRFVGPTTLYALMQAIGFVDDHLADCWCRGAASVSGR